MDSTKKPIAARKPCVVANWKMHGSKINNQKLFEEIRAGLEAESKLASLEIILCPPAVYLSQLSVLIHTKPSQNQNLKLGAQNAYSEKEGAYTGEISPNMLADLGCAAVIIGHSERRRLLAEDNQLIARKFLAAYHAGLIPILCVGETKEERGGGVTLEVIRNQIQAVLDLAGLAAFKKAMIAYEPVWAIGTGIAATAQDAEEVHAFIRSFLAEQSLEIAQQCRILYGGSVNGSNAKDLFAKPDIDGGLIGGASLKAQEFLAICSAAASK